MYEVSIKFYKSMVLWSLIGIDGVDCRSELNIRTGSLVTKIYIFEKTTAFNSFSFDI